MKPAENIESCVTVCVAQIDASHTAREHALTMSRALVRQCANTIRSAHRGAFNEAAGLLAEAGTNATALRAAVADYPHLLMAGYTQDALKEYAEASLVYAFLVGNDMPSAEILNIEPGAYLNGLAEAASELRRAILDRLRRNELAESEALLVIMEDVYSLLMTVDYPDAVTGGLRRSTDSLRSVLERTRADVTSALRQERLMEALAAFEQRVMHASEG